MEAQNLQNQQQQQAANLQGNQQNFGNQGVNIGNQASNLGNQASNFGNQGINQGGNQGNQAGQQGFGVQPGVNSRGNGLPDAGNQGNQFQQQFNQNMAQQNFGGNSQILDQGNQGLNNLLGGNVSCSFHFIIFLMPVHSSTKRTSLLFV